MLASLAGEVGGLARRLQAEVERSRQSSHFAGWRGSVTPLWDESPFFPVQVFNLLFSFLRGRSFVFGRSVRKHRLGVPLTA